MCVSAAKFLMSVYIYIYIYKVLYKVYIYIYIQSFFIMSVFAVALLAPAGWILHHIPEYRQRAKPPPS
uniref:Si:dkey-85n7.8 n=1 Tax=Sinocyclocheilus rhinocerous TaxID=307959 RepID=A0A673NCL7_9TELE